MGEEAVVAAVAQRLEQAFLEGPAAGQRALRELFADRVEYRHDPPLPSDGVIDADRIARSSRSEASAITSALVDQRHEQVDVVVDGDEVTVHTMTLGTLADGRSVHLPLEMRCRVDGGQIAAITHVMGAGAMKAWAEVAVAGGLTSARNLLDLPDGG